MLKFYWLDDNPERAKAAQSMQDATGAEVNFWDLKNKNLETELASLVALEQPSLIILDHNLEDTTIGIFKKGSTAAASIRETWNDCPIICITGEDIHNLSTIQRELYEDVFPISSISTYYETIKSIAISFDIAKTHRPNNAEDIIELLKAPKNEWNKLISILPTTLKENYSDDSLLVEISRWIRNTLIKRPGFLYDELWLSTLLGLRIESFNKVEDLFKPALYAGLFETCSGKRWWKSKVLEILYEESDLGGLPWQAGRGLKTICNDDYSKCYASGEEFPETVAFADQSSKPIEAPMKLKYTEIHPEFERLLHFEDLRLMKAAE